MLKNTFLSLSVAMLLFSCCENNYNYLYTNLPFEMPVVQQPKFHSLTKSLTEYGGVGDGTTLNTDAFNQAMKDISEKGGGTLTVPFGVWFTGPIVFQSNINLHLEKGALVLFSPDFDLYPLITTNFEGLDTKRCQSPISGFNLENIAITGNGSFNGSGHAWRPLKKDKVTEGQWKRVVNGGGVVDAAGRIWYPSENAYNAIQLRSDMNVPQEEMSDSAWLAIKDFLRPVMLNFVSCKNVMLQGVLFENSPAWCLHPLMCENLIVDNITVRNPSWSQNGDGIDVESCKNVIIVNSTFDVGDDAICIKSGKDKQGRERGIPTENLLVDNCIVFNGHGGFVVGSEMSGGARNMKITNCEFLGTDVGLRFKSRRGRGGVVENIYVENISMFDIATESLLFDLFYGGTSAVEALDAGNDSPKAVEIPAVTDETPAFRNIYIKNMISRNARRAMFFNGLPEMPITNINIENSYVTARIGAVLCEADGVKFTNVTVIPDSGEPIILQNVKNFENK
ncbi:MAG: glycoside hydrolase family 28 protein [Paludibacter sp.]|jgi:polygalacturonase|nr:glycoside hydrolase family 28 protein [Paludibacter sp.]